MFLYGAKFSGPHKFVTCDLSKLILLKFVRNFESI